MLHIVCKILLKFIKKSLEILHFNNQATTSDTSDKRQVAQTSTKLTPGHSNPGPASIVRPVRPWPDHILEER